MLSVVTINFAIVTVMILVGIIAKCLRPVFRFLFLCELRRRSGSEDVSQVKTTVLKCTPSPSSVTERENSD